MVGAVVALAAAVPGQARDHSSAPHTVDPHALFNGELAALTGDTLQILTIPDVKGESTAKGYEGGIDLMSVTIGASKPASMTPGGVGYTGPTKLDSLVVTHAYDLASPLLFAALSRGTLLRVAKVYFLQRNASGTTRPILTITLGNAAVSQVQDATSAGGGVESVTFVYASLRYEYVGPADQKVSACWDVAMDRAC
jgi:type VI secretion system secreted protein Hcp